MIDVPARPRKPIDLVDQVNTEGLTVLWVVDNQAVAALEVRQLAEDILRKIAELGDAYSRPAAWEVRWAVGAERFRNLDTGGQILFKTPRQNLHGFAGIDLIIDATETAVWGHHFSCDVNVLRQYGARLFEVDRG